MSEILIKQARGHHCELFRRCEVAPTTPGLVYSGGGERLQQGGREAVIEYHHRDARTCYRWRRGVEPESNMRCWSIVCRGGGSKSVSRGIHRGGVGGWISACFSLFMYLCLILYVPALTSYLYCHVVNSCISTPHLMIPGYLFLQSCSVNGNGLLLLGVFFMFVSSAVLSTLLDRPGEHLPLCC